MTTNFKEILNKNGFSMAQLAEALGVYRSTVTRWAKNKLPAERVLEVESATGIKREVLRPDLYVSATAKRAKKNKQKAH